MLNNNFAPWPSYTEEEANAIRKVLLSNKVNYWTGQEGAKFEQEFSAWVGTKYAVALTNGTAALEAALVALEIGPGDEVIVTARTFIASVSSIVSVGATPIFADVSLDSQNITPDSISEKLSAKTKAILCVHLAGWPCDMDPILAIAKTWGLSVIEDCAQAHGAIYKGRSVGSFGDIGCWSFCQDKIMTTGGEGGMITTNDRDLWSRIWSYKDHGKSWDAVNNREHPSGFRWLHDSFGTNFRMTEMQAAIGRIQITRMTEWTEKRTQNSLQIESSCRQFDALRVPEVPCYISHARYKFYVFVIPELLKSGWSRDQIISRINELNVPCYQGSCPEVYLERAFDGTQFKPDKPLPNAYELGETSLMFLVHPGLAESDINKTCYALEQVMSEASIRQKISLFG